MPKDTVKDLYQRWSDTFAERGELPLVEWRELIEEWGQATAEPGSVDYIEIDAGGVPAIWLSRPTTQSDAWPTGPAQRWVCEGGAAVRKLIESTLISLDGVIEAPNRWSIFDDESTAVAIEQLGHLRRVRDGPGTYQNLFARWAEIAGDPYTDRINAMPKYVASRSLTETASNFTLLGPDAAGAIAALKEQPGKDLIKYGTSRLDDLPCATTSSTNSTSGTCPWWSVQGSACSRTWTRRRSLYGSSTNAGSRTVR